MNITQNGITFNSVKTAGVSYDQWPIILTGQQGPDSDGGVVNAVDIDWNGAVLPNANITIKTTGELLKRIDDMQQEIYTLITALGNKTNIVDIADYINTDKIMPKAALYTYKSLPISNMRWCVDDVNDKILVFRTGYKNSQVENPYVPTDVFYIVFIEGGPTFSGWVYAGQFSIEGAPSYITDMFSE